VPAEAGLNAGKVAHSNASFVPFNPIGFAFRNTSVAAAGITHVVVWDALPHLQDGDRLTRCNVTATLANASDGGAAADGGAADGDTPAATDAWLVVLGNGSVYEQPPSSHGPVFPSSPLEPITFEATVYDAPLLVARRDAIPAWTPAVLGANTTASAREAGGLPLPRRAA